MSFLLSHKIFLCGLKRYSTKIMRYLNVAEKNDAAKGISAILSKGASNRREGLSKYNKIYEFEGTVFGQRAKMIMTSVSGHLLNFAFHPSFRNWQSCNAADLFDAPIQEICLNDMENIKKTLEREIRTCDGLILWTDCDREGENIGFEIIRVCKDVKSNISVYRAKFSEITGPSIFRALSTLGQPNKNISDAVDVRKELDLRTGAAFTRLQTLRLQKAFPSKLSDKVISYGSCQFPTLGFVVDRYLSIENFIPETFWKIKMNHKIKDMTTEFLWKRDRLFDKNACEAILDICKESNLAKVESVESRSKSKWRPLPLDTVEMEKTISKKLRINAKTAMSIAEKLYTQGFISYPRTETNIYPKELNLSNIVEQQTNDGNWGPFAQRILNEGGPTPRAGKKSDQAHPPIHPTKYAPGLSGQEKAVYEYIVRHFLASVHKDAQGFETTVTVDLADEKFTAKGLVILEKNYLDVYIYEKWTGKEINNYQQGETFTPTTLDMAEGNTSPPKLLTEAELIALMDKHGIGTDATHAEHIDKIQTREYVGLHENMYFVPGTLGMGLVEGYNNIGLEVSLAKPILRAEFENDLKLICDGVKDAEVVRREQVAKYRAVFQTVEDKIREIDKSLANRLGDAPVQIQQAPGAVQDSSRPVLKCPKCGDFMFFRNRKTGAGKFLTCGAYPSCKNSAWPSAVIESVEVLNEHCNSCGPDTKKVKMKFRQNPLIGEPNPTILCIGGCDVGLLESLDIPLSSVKRPNSSNVEHNANGRQQNTNRPSQNHSSGRPSSSWPSPILQTPSNNTVRRPSDVTPVQQYNSPVIQNSSNSDIVCLCDNAASLLTCQNGQNKGRKFYKCSNNACGFFLWQPNSSAASTSMASTSMDTSGAVTVKCRCNQPAKLCTVMKQNENHGRKFYACSKPQSESCKFFQWADNVEQNTNSDYPSDGGGGGGSWRGGNRGRGGGTHNPRNPKPKPYDKNNQPRAKRKCGICGQEGHTRQRCPNS
ncbi:DNA topoisomerase 3-alpha isoform X2 [Harmonia axyridis]|uniref:DNA topoisomerase 3-alpha isoform X2 n=1 Tax=Harmonia axyridis TaxID=115357 RepID=UPI001E2759F0|nr:DNA topoisomerase 3-alpha isoform X2 [Harmonia axyridis]